MTTIIALFNTKGGSGKTTSTMFLASEFASRGYSVRVVDADPQQSATLWYEDAGDMSFALSTVRLEHLKRFKRPSEDIVLIDCPPGEEEVLQQVIAHSDIFLVPMKTGMLDVVRGVKTIQHLHATTQHEVLPLVTMAQLNTREYRDTMAFLSDQLPEWVGRGLPEGLRIRNLMVYSEVAHEPITRTYDYSAVATTLLKELDI